MSSISSGTGGHAYVHRCENFVDEIKVLFADWNQRCPQQKVSRPYFEGQPGSNGFLWDLFTSIRAMGLGDAIKGLQPKLDPSGDLPYKTFFSRMVEGRLADLEKMSQLHNQLETDRKAGEGVDPVFKPLLHYFDNREDTTQRAEAGRFILLISEGCAALAKLKRSFSSSGTQLLKDLTSLVHPHLNDKPNPQHSVHQLAQNCWEKLRVGISQDNLDFREYKAFMDRLLEDRKKHLAKWMVLLSRPSSGNDAQLQEIHLHLEVQSHWSGMDQRKEVQGLKSHEDFCRHQKAFHERLENRLQSLGVFTRKMEKEMDSGVTISRGFHTVIEGIIDLLTKCSEIGKSFPPQLTEAVSRNLQILKRLNNRLINYQKEQRSNFHGWPTFAVTRYEYLEKDSLRVLFRENDREIRSWSRCLPYLHKAFERDLSVEGCSPKVPVKQILEELLSSSGRILRKNQ